MGLDRDKLGKDLVYLYCCVLCISMWDSTTICFVHCCFLVSSKLVYLDAWSAHMLRIVSSHHLTLSVSRELSTLIPSIPLVVEGDDYCMVKPFAILLLRAPLGRGGHLKCFWEMGNQSVKKGKSLWEKDHELIGGLLPAFVTGGCSCVHPVCQ